MRFHGSTKSLLGSTRSLTGAKSSRTASTPPYVPATPAEGGTLADIHRLAVHGPASALRTLLEMRSAAGEPVQQLVCTADPASRTTALHAAAHAGKHGCVETLLRWGAHVDTVNTLGWTPLMLAARYGGATSVRVLLLARADVVRELPDGQTALDLAHEAQREAVQRAASEPSEGSKSRRRSLARINAVGLLEEAEQAAWDVAEETAVDDGLRDA